MKQPSVDGQCHAVDFELGLAVAGSLPASWPLADSLQPVQWLAGDKSYDVPCVFEWFRRRRTTAIIPEKHKPHGRKPGRPPVFDAETYRRRNAIERSISWLKHARRIATRYEKLAVNFLAMLKLAMIQRFLRIHL